MTLAAATGPFFSASALGLDLEKSADKAKVKGMIHRWIKSGELIKVEGLDERPHSKIFVEVCATRKSSSLLGHLIPLHHHLPTPKGVAQWRSGAERYLLTAPPTLRHLAEVAQNGISGAIRDARELNFGL